MNLARKKQLFNGYVNYWLVKLNLLKKYIIQVRMDRRIDCGAETRQIDYKTYIIAYNPNKLRSDREILHTALHELGHMLHKWNGSNESHEQFAEHWALSTAKEHYPKKYRLMVNSTKKSVKSGLSSKEHLIGYTNALKQLGELNV